MSVSSRIGCDQHLVAGSQDPQRDATTREPSATASTRVAAPAAALLTPTDRHASDHIATEAYASFRLSGHPTASDRIGDQALVSACAEADECFSRIAITRGRRHSVDSEDRSAHIGRCHRLPDQAALGDGVEGVEVDELDLGDLESVAAFADRFLASGRSIDFMIDNAGVMAVADRTLLGPGWEMQFATNHLGHFALVNRLWPAIAGDGGGRVAPVSSRGHHRSPVRWDDPHFEHTPYDKWEAYGQAKTSNVLFAVHLDTLGQDAGVRAFALHPGAIMTPLQRHLRREEMVAAGWLDEDGNVKNPNFKTPEQGAATEVWCATSPQLDGMGGVYCEDCDIATMAQEGDPSQGVRGYAVDPGQAERLWALSAELTGIDAFATPA